ncbi:hypothetical protein GPECTOR_153g65 [Gonium pectorale]|uniref:LysM domain-containing protein n=1 Tax=Gonium pectorale TaxID=33097 RepID=A0A150FXQ0_GONPE|nr:hypothetical protein GPECTOR_153g65 [Gonium pectorale]|eukprot:KXZ42392.1 hypothetical protein GPECTOR_153g65 [Gonium pectorale]
MNRTLGDMLRNFAGRNPNTWDTHLTAAEFAINNAVNRSTGKSPFFLNYGFHPALPVWRDLEVTVPAAKAFVRSFASRMAEAKSCLEAAQQRAADYYNRYKKDVTFVPDQLVLLNTKNLRKRAEGPKKLLPRWIGPYPVVRMVASASFDEPEYDGFLIKPIHAEASGREVDDGQGFKLTAASDTGPEYFTMATDVMQSLNGMGVDAKQVKSTGSQGWLAVPAPALSSLQQAKLRYSSDGNGSSSTDGGGGGGPPGIIDPDANGRGVPGPSWNSIAAAMQQISARAAWDITRGSKREQGARITSNSWVTPGKSDTLEDEIRISQNAGHLFIAAAAPDAQRRYTATKGDTLASVAAKLGVSARQLADANPNLDPNPNALLAGSVVLAVGSGSGGAQGVYEFVDGSTLLTDSATGPSPSAAGPSATPPPSTGGGGTMPRPPPAGGSAGGRLRPLRGAVLASLWAAVAAALCCCCKPFLLHTA